jgi:sugar lactone lactonase YvrE
VGSTVTDALLVDSKGPTVNRYNPRDGFAQTWKVPSDIGSMALRKMGGAILALRDGIYTFDFEEGQSELIIAIDEKIRALASTTARLIDAVEFFCWRYG